MSEVNRDQSYYLHCAGGYRSVIASSILKSRGFHNLVNIQGGYKALCEMPLKRTEHVEQVTEL
jgi:rhodanese-related sulfurtransferase